MGEVIYVDYRLRPIPECLWEDLYGPEGIAWIAPDGTQIRNEIWRYHSWNMEVKAI